MQKLILPLLLFTLVLFSCKSAKISSEYNKEVPFEDYQTFMFLNWNPDNSKMIDEVERNRIYKTIEEELTQRGLKKVDMKADVAVNVMVIINKERNYHAMYNLYRPAYYSYYYGYGYGENTYNYGTPYRRYSVTEFDTYYGGLVIDLFDVKEKKQIWQGSATGKVSGDEKQREVGGPKAVENIFKKYPVDKVK